MNKWIFGIITCITIFVLWYFQNAITVNIPWWDDFHGIILPVHDLFTDKSFSDKFQNFISLNNEHRVINDRFFTLAVYLFYGKFELKTLAMLGLLNMVAIFYVIFKVFRKEKINYWAILPVVFLIFHAQYFESLHSLMVPFQNFSVILYMLISIYLIVFRNSFWGGFAFALLALLSHGNGILVFIIGALLLLINQKYRQGIYWTILSVISIFIYFLGYSKPSWTNTDVISPLDNPIAAIRYFFEFLGAYSLNIVELSNSLNQTSVRQILPQIVGFGSLVFLLIIFFKKYPLKDFKESLEKLKSNKSDQFFLGMLAFFVGTGMLMGLTRTGFPVLSRYTINSSFFLIGIWGFYTINHKNVKGYWMSFITFSGLLLTYYNAAEIGLFKKENTIADSVNYQLNGTWASQYSDSSHVSRVNPLLIEPLKSGAYVFPKSDLEGFQNWNSISKKSDLDYSIVDDHLIISGSEDLDTQLYYSLESSDYQFVFPVYKLRNNPKNFILKRSYFSDLYRTVFPISVIPKGEYKIYKIEKKDGKYLKYDLGRTLSQKSLIL